MATSFTDSLASLSHRLRRRIGVSRLLAACALAGICLGASAATDAWVRPFPLSTGERWAVLAISLAGAGAVGVAAFLLARKRWRGPVLARALDASAKGNGLFTTAWETLQAPPEADALRQNFRELLQARAAVRLVGLDTRPIVGQRCLIAPCALLAAVLATLAVVSIQSPEFRTGLHRVTQPWWEPAPPISWRNFVLENHCTLEWPTAFGRAATPVSGADVAFPEQSALVWRLRLAGGCTKGRIELRRQGGAHIETIEASSLRKAFPKAGRFEARIAFDISPEELAKAGEPVDGTDPTRSPWVAFECREDRAPTVVLEKPEGAELPASPIAPLPCAVRAQDDWGLVKAGIGMMVDGVTTEEALLPLASEAGQSTDAAGPLILPMARHAGLGAENSVLVFAFAEDAAGHRTVSTPVALDIQPLLGAPDQKGPQQPEPEDEKEDGGAPPDKKEKADINALIRLQRAVTGKTLAAPGDIQRLVRDQAQVLKALETGELPEPDAPSPPSPAAPDAPLH